MMKTLYDGFMKNGDKEKFYGKFYGQIPLNATRYFQGLSLNSATLLATKVADSILTYCKLFLPTSDEYSPSQTLLSDKETSGLQYILGGYVLHNLHKKYAKHSTHESQQALAILKASKLSCCLVKH